MHIDIDIDIDSNAQVPSLSLHLMGGASDTPPAIRNPHGVNVGLQQGNALSYFVAVYRNGLWQRVPQLLLVEVRWVGVHPLLILVGTVHTTANISFVKCFLQPLTLDTCGMKTGRRSGTDGRRYSTLHGRGPPIRGRRTRRSRYL